MVMGGHIMRTWKRVAVVGILVGVTVFGVMTQASGQTFLQDGKGYWWDFDPDGSVRDGAMFRRKRPTRLTGRCVCR
jgi:hypothetical protein